METVCARKGPALPEEVRLFKRRKPETTTDHEFSAPQPASAGMTEALLNGSAAPDLPRLPMRPAEHGLGVPPYRPAPSKEVSPMGRTPFSAPSPAVPPLPPPAAPNGSAPSLVTAVRPVAPPTRLREAADRRTLVVGRGIALQGTVSDAERLIVEGTVEASMIQATELSIASGGVFKGEVEVEDAEIAGVIDGTLTARGNLIVRATGKVLGTARCRRLQVEDGGQITGRIEMLTEGASKPEAARPVEVSA